MNGSPKAWHALVARRAIVVRWALVASIAFAVLLAPAAALAQTPAPASAAPVIGSGDSRSEGEGPGFVGSPLAIALGVVVLGVVTAVGTVLVVRVAGTRRGG